jgi:hypothetical protein
MSDEPKKRSRWWMRGWIWWAIPVLLVLYPLSIGPTYWLCEHMGWFSGDVGSERFWAVYAPVYWIADQSETANDALQWYLSLWGESGPRPFGLGGGMF